MSDLYSSNFNLLMLNVWIGMCKGTRGLPRDLIDLGYQNFWIEYRFTNQEGDAIVPELIIGSERLGHTMLLEWKSGANLDDDQLQRYSKVSTADLVAKAFLKSSVCVTFDVTVVGKEKFVDRLKIGLTKGSHSFPLISVTPSYMALVLNSFKRSEPTSTFTPRLDVDLTVAPIGFVPFSEESELWEIAEIVMPHVVHLMMKREATFTLGDVCSQLLPVWKIMDDCKQGQVREKIKGVLVEASKNEFRRYIGRNRGLEGRTDGPTWEIKRNPLDLSSTKRSSEYKALQKLQKAFLKALKTGKRDPIQEDLFES